MLKVLFSLLLLGAHPFHISVTDIEFDKEAKSIEVSQKIFIDDLEEVLRGLGHTNIDLVKPDQKEKNDEIIKQYVTNTFTFEVNGKATS